MDAVKEVYQDYNLENIKFSKFCDLLKQISQFDKNPLYKGLNINQLSFALRCVKWAEECGKMVLYKDPFVLKHKNNYRLLRKIHYQVKSEKCLNLNLSMISTTEHIHL